MSDALVVFKAVTHDAEKQMLFQKLLASNEAIQLRDKADQVIALKALSINSNAQVKCRLPEDCGTFDLDCIYTASFYIGNEKYLFETQPKIHAGLITLPILNLFHLQRRKNFRYVLPEGYPGALHITDINQQKCYYPCQLLDLSVEGCAVHVGADLTNIQLGDLLEAQILLGARTPITVQGFIKNLRPHGMAELVLGIEFNHLSNSCEGTITQAITDLQRELYFRRAG